MIKLKSILIVAVAFTLMSCNCKQKQETVAVQQVTQEKVVELITATELEKVDESVQLIDVRTPDEFNGGHIKNAKNINFFEGNFIDQMSKLNKDEALYIYCRSGGRSGKAAQKLKNAGFTKVYDLQGGFMKWQSEGKEIIK